MVHCYIHRDACLFWHAAFLKQTVCLRGRQRLYHVAFLGINDFLLACDRHERDVVIVTEKPNYTKGIAESQGHIDSEMK